MGTEAGITLHEIARRSFLKEKRENYINPEAADVDKVVASVDPSTLAVGGALTLVSAVSAKLLRRGRRATVSVTDASGGGGGLAVGVRVSGYRKGVLQTETITATATSGSEATATGSLYFDQFLAPQVASLTAAASGDALKVGIDGTSFALDERIAAVSDVKSIINVSSGTEAAPTAISSTTVDATQSAIKGITVAATDNWEIQYQSNGADGVGSGGVEG